MSETDDPLVSVRNLELHYPVTEGLLRRETGRVRAVDGVSFDIRPGESFGLVGESGCGKSSTALAMLRMEEPTGGEIRFDGEDVLEYDAADLRRYRRRVQLVLQDPDSAFNPRMTVGEAVGEPLRVHGLSDSERRREIVADALERVGLSGEDADDYPHEFSGGEKQRIAIARALVLNPDVIVADEPVSALDGRTKAEVLDLLDDLQDRFGIAIVLISHDIDLVRRFCDRVAVMYLGEIVERGPTETVVGDPSHPYTRTLVASIPSLDPAIPAADAGVDLLTDDLPDATDVPSGCRFHPRCPAIIPPESVDLPRDHWQGVVAFRFRLEREWDDADELRASILREVPPAERSDTDIGTAVRAAFGLPEELADADVEAAVEAAVKAIESGDLDAARRPLAETTTSVCERESPAVVEVETAHPVSCHRYDPSVPGDPETGIETRPSEE
jgi:peptide/nickel transport system ATP-binding protein